MFSLYSFCAVLFIVYGYSFFCAIGKKLDYLKFQESSVSQSNIVEIFEAIHEIKLHQLEDKKISEWKQTQKKLYNASIVHVIISFEK